MSAPIEFMKTEITNNFRIKDQEFLSAKSWRKAWAEWGSADPELSDMAATIMHHSVDVRQSNYLAPNRKNLAKMGVTLLKRVLETGQCQFLSLNSGICPEFGIF